MDNRKYHDILGVFVSKKLVSAYVILSFFIINIAFVYSILVLTPKHFRNGIMPVFLKEVQYLNNKIDNLQDKINKLDQEYNACKSKTNN